MLWEIINLEKVRVYSFPTVATRQGFVFAGNLDDVRMWRQQTKYGINGLLTTHLAKICSWHSFDEHLGANYSSRLNAHRNT